MDLFTLSTVLMPMVDNPDDPTGGNPDAMVIDGERLDPDDVDVSEEDVDDTDLEDDIDGTPEADPDDDTEDDQGNFKQRYGDSVRWGQQQKARADALEARINRFERHGINLAEIESLLPPEERAASPNVQNMASKQDLAQMAQTVQWNMARGTFMQDNPEFRKDKEMSAELEFQASKIIQENVRQMGALTLTPDRVYVKAAKAVKARLKALEDKGKKKATQTRQKVKSQGADMGGSTGKRTGKASEEDEKFDPRASYMGFSKI